MRPRMKDVFWERSGAELRLVYHAREPVRLDDPDGLVELLLDLLRKGSRTPQELADVVGVGLAAVNRVVAVLDRHRLLVDDERLGRVGGSNRDRYADDLSFFEPYATLAVGQEDMVERLQAAHVMVLGLGGVNAAVVAHLSGLGVDRLTLVDSGLIGQCDLAWQHMARQRDVGTRIVRRAAAWVRDVDPILQVDAVDEAVADVSALKATLDRYCPDLVVVDVPPGGFGSDSPIAPLDARGARAVDGTDGVDYWVNAACVAARVPFVRAAIGETGAMVYSVDPGRSACVACLMSAPGRGQSPVAVRLLCERPTPALRVGPVAGLLGSLAAFEAIRFLTEYEPPAYAGCPGHVDFAGGVDFRRVMWQRNVDCPVCGRLRR